MYQEIEFATASFTPQSGPEEGTTFEVHFNPTSLQYSVKNTLEQKGQGNSKKQFVSQSTASLTMDLVFDTTDTGENVRVYAEPIAHFMEPQDKVPPVILFEWGAFTFQGMVESYKETIDFFAPTGVPLRATVNLTLASQDKVFEDSDTSATFDTQQAGQKPPVQGPPGQSASKTAAQGGNARAAHALATANDQNSVRFAAGPLVVEADIKLGGPVAFSTGGAGLSAGAGLGIGGGAGAGIGIGAGAELSAGVSASAGGGLSIGGNASAGVSATAGAFAGLQVKAGTKATAALNPEKLLPPKPTFNLPTDSGASFSMGGQASLQGSASLKADVGAEASLRGRIQFDEG
jgi:hypothetical protein